MDNTLNEKTNGKLPLDNSNDDSWANAFGALESFEPLDLQDLMYGSEHGHIKLDDP